MKESSDNIETNRTITGKFYKYRSISSEVDRQRIISIIVDNELYYAKPSQFNDPYDCYPVAIHSDVAELRKYHEGLFASRLKKDGVKILKKELSRRVTNAVQRMQNPSYRNKMLYMALEQNTGIFSMSKKNNSILQWAYYAESHTGICLEFTVPEEAKWFTVPVDYVQERPIVDILYFASDTKYRAEVMIKVTATKSFDWKHEEEARVYQLKGGRSYPYSPELLTGIIFGTHTNDEDKQFIKDLVDNSKANPKFYSCELTNDTYDIVVKG